MAEYQNNKAYAQSIRLSAAKCFAAAFLLLILVHAAFAPACAAEDQSSLRVGFFAYDDYHHIAEDGARSGYGYDLLQIMARYADVSYTYHGYDESMAENEAMLTRGEIDVLTGIKWTEERAREFDFSSRSIGNVTTVLTVKAGSNSIVSGSYETYNDMRIGIQKGTNRDRELAEYAKKKGFAYTGVYFDTTQQMEQALQSGEVDALISTNFRTYQNEWIIDSFNEEPFYAVVRKGDNDTLTLINNVLNRMDREEPDWRVTLTQAHQGHRTSSILFLTESERAYLSEQTACNRIYQVLVNPDRYPYSYIEDGQMKGIMISLFDLIARRAGIQYEWVISANREDYAKRLQGQAADICVDISPDYFLAEDSGYAITDVYLSAPFSWIRRFDSLDDIDLGAKLVYTAFTPAQYAYDNVYHDIDYIVYPTTEECVKSVLSGETDGYCTYTYKAERLVLDDASGVLVSNIALTENQFAIGTAKNIDRRLTSILNKAVNSIEEWERVDIIRKHTTIASPSFSFVELFMKDRQFSIVVLAMCCALLVLLLYAFQQVRYQRVLKKKIHIQDLRLSESLRGMLDVLATAIEFRSSESGDHVKRIRSITSEVMTALTKAYPEEYRFSETEIDQIATAAVLHDVGKIAIPDHILNKPGKLTPLEFKVIKQHPIKGCELLEHIPNLKGEPLYAYAYDICRWHHERWDGRGYPDGLSGDDIPIWAQVAAIADVYDALTSPRVYKEAYSREKAVDMIRAGECGSFNPKVIEAFLSVVDQFEAPTITQKELFNQAPAGRDITTLMISAFQSLLNNTSDLVFLKDVDLIYRAASPAFAKMTGDRTPEEVICHTDSELFSDQGLARRYVADDLKLLSSGMDLIDYLEPISKQDGAPRYGSTSKYLLTDSQGRIMGILGITRDVTNEYFAKKHHQKELKYLFSLPEDAYFFVYVDLNTWHINGENSQSVNGIQFPMYETIEEYARWGCENIVDRRGPAYAFYQSFDKKTFQSIYESGKNEMVMEFLCRMPDGATRWIRDEIKFMIDPTNGHIGFTLIIRDIQAKKEAEKHMIERAERDSLTGLMNRASFEMLTRKMLKEKHSSCATHAMFVIDIDNFKQVNDTLGHRAGDNSLKQIGHAILSCFRSNDLVARLGGDEFVVLMCYITDRTSVEEKASHLLNALNMRFGDHNEIEVSASIGVSLYPMDGSSIEELYERADQAMYHAKRNGKNSIFFAADM